jgi:predicted dinucleotide-binding enzyme
MLYIRVKNIKEQIMNIGVIGSGVVGKALAQGFLKYGDQVMVGSRDPKKLESWKTVGHMHLGF